MKKTKVDYFFVVGGILLLGIGLFFVKSIVESQGFMKAFPYVCISYDSEGATQAKNFINNVPKTDHMLPPVIDVEFYGDKEKNLPSREIVTEQLSVMIDSLQEYYGMTPIIYATEKSYMLFISDSFDECDIWIRNVVFLPRLSDNRQWTFWQYTNRGQLKGYSGREKFIDINVFCGTEDEFCNYAK